MQTRQEELFSHWGYKCNQIRELRNFIQNDFKDLKKEGMITKEQIYQEKVKFLSTFEKLTKELEVLRNEIAYFTDKELDTF